MWNHRGIDLLTGGLQETMFKPSANTLRNATPKKHVDRREPRQPTMKSGSICADGADMHLACTIRDIHSSGARLSVMNMAGLGESFLLIVRSENLVARAKIAWKKGNEIGVRFLRKDDLSQEEKYRTDQQYHYKKETERAVKQQQEAHENALAEEQARAQAEAYRVAQIRITQMQIMGMDLTKPYSEEDLKSAYRKQAMTMHPDQGGDPGAFHQMQEVYKIMMEDFARLVASQQGSAA